MYIFVFEVYYLVPSLFARMLMNMTIIIFSDTNIFIGWNMSLMELTICRVQYTVGMS